MAFDGEVRIGLYLDDAEFKKQLPEAVSKALKDSEKTFNSLNKIGDSFVSTGLKMTAAVTAPILALGGLSVKAGMDFEAAMSSIAATSGATAEELTIMEDKARELGRTTQFSATQVAEAFKYIVLAGGDPIEMFDSLSGVTALAAATNTDLARTAEITADSLVAFGLSAKDADHFANVMAATTSVANVTLDQLGETMKFAAPSASILGYSLEDVAEAIGLMANVGIKGSQAGTTLRSAFTSLAKPTKDAAALMDKLGLSITDSTGAVRPFSDIVQDLRKEFIQMTPEVQAQNAAILFGQNAMSGMSAVLRTVGDDYDLVVNGIRNADSAFKGVGQAAGMAAIQQDNLQGTLSRLKGAVTDAGIQFANFLIPIIEKAAGVISGLANWFSNMDDRTAKVIITVAGLAAVIGPLFLVLGTGVKIFAALNLAVQLSAAAMETHSWTAIRMAISQGTASGSTGALSLAMWGATTAANALNISTGGLLIAVGAIAAAIGGGIAAISHFSKANEEARQKQEELRQEIINSGTTFEELGRKATDSFTKVRGLGDLTAKYNELSTVVKNQTSTTEQLKTAEEELARVRGELKNISGGLITDYDIENGLLNEKLGIINRIAEIEYNRAKRELEQQLRAVSKENLEDTIKGLEKTIELNEQSRSSEERHLLLLQGAQAILHDETLTTKEREAALQDYIGTLDTWEAYYVGMITHVERSNVVGSVQVAQTKKVDAAIKQATDNIDGYSQAIDVNTGEWNDAIISLEKRNMVEAEYDLLEVDNKIREQTKAYDEGTAAYKRRTPVLRDIARSTEEVAEAQNRLADDIKGFTSEMNTLQNMYDKVRDGQQLSADEILNLIDLYPEMIAFINDENDLLEDKGALFETIAKARKESIIKQLEMEADLLRADIEAAKARIETTKEEYIAKAAIAANYYMSYRMVAEEAKDITAEQADELKNLTDQLANVEAKIKAVNTITLDMTEINKKAKGSTKEAADEVEEARKKYREFTDELSYKFKTGAIDAEEYYNQLKYARDTFLEENISEWRNANLEILKIEEDKKKQTIDKYSELSDAVVKALETMYKGQQANQTDFLKDVQKYFDDAYKGAAKSLDYNFKDMEYTINNFYKTLENKSDDAFSVDNKNLLENVKQFEEAHNAKMRMLSDQYNAIAGQYDEEEARLQGRIDDLRRMTEEEDEALRRAEFAKREAELEVRISEEADPEKIQDLMDQLADIREKEARRLLLIDRKAEEESLKEQITANREAKQTALEAKQAEIDALTEQRDTFYANELTALNTHYEELLKAENIQAEALKVLNDKSQINILNLLKGYAPDYFKKGQDLGEQLYQGYKEKVDKILALLDELRQATDSATPSGIEISGIGIQSFASEGIARRPTLAIVGDTPDAEYMLREGTLTALLHDMVLRTLSGLTNTSQVAEATTRMEMGKTVQVYQTLNFYDGQSSYYRTMREANEQARRLAEGL